MKLASRLTAFALLLAVLGVGLIGIQRSLWLDEAWVANSLREPSLHGMFFYPGWLQVTPPLFLLLARATLFVAGASNAAFRLVPLMFSLAAAALLLAASRRVLTTAMAGLATALVIFDGTAVEYSHTLKPYSAELACACALLLAAFAYLDRPDRGRFRWLLAAAAISLPLAYSSVFLLPGIVLLVISHRRRAAELIAVSAAILLPLYWFYIRPNFAPELRAFVAQGRDPLTASMAAALLFCGACAIYLVTRFAKRSATPREWSYLLCLVPCLLLAVAGTAGWYAVIHRTRLFALPCFVLLALMAAQHLLEPRIISRRVLDGLAIALTVGVAAFAVATQLLVPANTYEEDFAGAVAYLQAHSAAQDLILVHACCKEGFELYAALDHFAPPHLLYGDTGWPCCARGKNARPGESSAPAALASLDSKIPHGYTGRVWLFYTSRPTHWQYTGLDEGNLWRNHLWDRGCPPGPYIRFANLAISPMNCSEAR